MQTALKRLFSAMPFLFGIGVLAPLIAQALVAFGISAPFGFSPIVFGLAIGASWGFVAAVRGTWL